MEEIRLEEARKRIGDIVDRARLAGEHTLITRQGKPAAVVVGSGWYADIAELMETLEVPDVYRGRIAVLRTGRRAAGLSPDDRRIVHHIDGNPRNNDPSNLELRDPEDQS